MAVNQLSIYNHGLEARDLAVHRFAMILSQWVSLQQERGSS
jgi:hypothetical protein